MRTEYAESLLSVGQKLDHRAAGKRLFRHFNGELIAVPACEEWLVTAQLATRHRAGHRGAREQLFNICRVRFQGLVSRLIGHFLYAAEARANQGQYGQIVGGRGE
jgi:hypothetical protein